MFNKIITWINQHNLLLILLFTYALLSIIKIDQPGPNNDQLIFVNTATFNPDNQFLWKSFHGFPLMVFPYIGALKAYVYMPIFYFFGVNMWTIRLPHVLITALALFILYKTLEISLNKKIALLSIFFICLDPSYILYSKIDTGPNVLEFFFKILTIFWLYLYLTQKKLIYFLIIFPSLALGIFHKLNFFWFVNSFLISFFLTYGWDFYHSSKKLGRWFPFAVIIIPYLALLKIFLKMSNEVTLSYKDFSNEVSPINLISNLPIYLKNMIDMVNGNMFFQIAYQEKATIFGEIFALIFFLIIALGVRLAFSKFSYKNSFIKAYSFYLLNFLIMSLEIIATKRAVSPWHYLAIYPFFTILLGTASWLIWQQLKTSAHRVAFSSLIILMVIFLLSVNLVYLFRLGSPTKNVAYSASIYDLVEYARTSNQKFVCLDVDICNQLLSLTQQTGKYDEKFGYLDPDTYQYSFSMLLKNFQTPDQYLYITHSPENTHMPQFRTAIFTYLQKNGITYQKVKDFYDGPNHTFQVYKIGYY